MIANYTASFLVCLLGSFQFDLRNTIHINTVSNEALHQYSHAYLDSNSIYGYCRSENFHCKMLCVNKP